MLGGMYTRVLALAPHPDDVEVGAGGLVSRIVSQGDDTSVLYVAFSKALESLPVGSDADVLRRELMASTSVLGIPSSQVRLFDYPVRRFDSVRQDILEEMVRLAREFKPDLVLSPTLQDRHQDHGIIAQEAVRAFRAATILGYEQPWNQGEFAGSCFARLDPEDLDRKIGALKCFKSQYHRSYVSEEVVRGLAYVRGAQSRCQIAECYEAIRLFI